MIDATIALGVAIGVAGFTLLIHTAFFVYKLYASRKDDYELIHHAEKGQFHSGSGILDGSIHISSAEVNCFMGVIWSSCMDGDRMTKSMFVTWYITVACIDVGVAVGTFFLLEYLLGQA